MGTIADAIAWSGSGVTLSMFVVSEGGLLLDVTTLLSECPSAEVRTYALDDAEHALPGRCVVEYDLKFSEIPANLDSILSRCLRVAQASGAVVAWFGFEGSFDFGYLLTAEVANQVFGVVDSEGIEFASDVTLPTEAWRDRIVRAGVRLRGNSEPTASA